MDVVSSPKKDNSPLTNPSGYRIYFGTSSSNPAQVLDLPNPGLSGGVVESERSNVTSNTIG